MRGSGPGQIALRADVDDGRRHRAVGLDRLRIRLEVALRGDEVDKLLGDVDVRLFKRAGPDGADDARTGFDKDRDRKSVGLGTGGCVRGDLGGGWSINKKKER